MSQQSAQRLKESYTPADQEKFDRMCLLLGNVETQEELNKAVLLYIMDMSYDRADIATADSYTAHVKGWKGGTG